MSVVGDVQAAGLTQDLEAAGEAVTVVTPGGGEREILALVDRGSPSQVPPTNAYSAPAITVTVANSTTDGIGSAELDVGTWSIRLAQRPGQAAVTRPVGRLIAVTESRITLEIR